MSNLSSFSRQFTNSKVLAPSSRVIVDGEVICEKPWHQMRYK